MMSRFQASLSTVSCATTLWVAAQRPLFGALRQGLVTIIYLVIWSFSPNLRATLWSFTPIVDDTLLRIFTEVIYCRLGICPFS
jgi:hypothetical protein